MYRIIRETFTAPPIFPPRPDLLSTLDSGALSTPPLELVRPSLVR